MAKKKTAKRIMTLDEGLAEFRKQQLAPSEVSVSTFAGVSPCRQNKPNKSLSLKVRKSDRAEAMEDAKKRGVPTFFNEEGRPVFTSRAHQAKYRKSYGYANLDGGYGD